jgi:anti-anti-sigma factor
MNGQPLTPGSLEIASSTSDGVVTVALRGELDLASVRRLEELLVGVEERQPERIVIDLADLAFIDSSGLRVLLLADARAREHGRMLLLTPGTEPVRRVLEMTGALDLLRFETRSPPAR